MDWYFLQSGGRKHGYAKILPRSFLYFIVSTRCGLLGRDDCDLQSLHKLCSCKSATKMQPIKVIPRFATFGLALVKSVRESSQRDTLVPSSPLLHRLVTRLYLFMIPLPNSM
jgi:hypothetical protein